MKAQFRAIGAALLAVPAAAAAEDTPICADRPAKANAPCTVPAGTMQVESGSIDWVQLDGGDTLFLGATTIKFGLGETADIELGIVPYARVGRESGFGDMTVRLKRRLTQADARVQVAVIPFVKLPTASRPIGNGKVEGGVALPVSLALGGPVSMTFGPELDVLADGAGSGRHLAVVNVVNLAAAISPHLTVAGELWVARDWDPSGRATQASADAAVAYAARRRLQLDAGVNLGLNRATPRVEVYAGFSARF